MFVRQLIGRLAGQIMDMPTHAAEACLANGSVVRATEEEIVAAGMTPPAPPPVEASPLVPPGYEAASRIDGQGYDLFKLPLTRNERGDITDEPLNPAPLHNLAALRDFVAQVVEAPPQTPPGDVVIPEGWADLNAADMKALAKALGATEPLANKAQAAAFIEGVVAERAKPQEPA